MQVSNWSIEECYNHLYEEPWVDPEFLQLLRQHAVCGPRSLFARCVVMLCVCVCLCFLCFLCLCSLPGGVMDPLPVPPLLHGVGCNRFACFA